MKAYIVTMTMEGMKQSDIRLVSCRTGVPEFRVLWISSTTRVSTALVLIPAVWQCRVLAAPTAVLTMALLMDPAIGTDLLAITDLLTEEELSAILLLIGSPLLGWTSMTLLICILLMLILSLVLLCLMCVAWGRSLTRVWTVLLALVPVPALSSCLSRTRATTILMVLQHIRCSVLGSS